MKTVSAYHHTTQGTQAADPAPGQYYCTVKDGERLGLLAGPFRSHKTALDMLPQARAVARERDPFSAFYAFGTVKMKEDFSRPGVLNDLLGVG